MQTLVGNSKLNIIQKISKNIMNDELFPYHGQYKVKLLPFDYVFMSLICLVFLVRYKQLLKYWKTINNKYFIDFRMKKH